MGGGILNSRKWLWAHYGMLFACLAAVAFWAPFSLWGQDAYLGWGPTIAEYLRGDGRFGASPVTFGGQNLMAIYGYLPFWRLCRWAGLNFIATENASFWVFQMLLQYYSLSIFRSFRPSRGLADFFVPAAWALLCPVLVNRLYSGHVNLLFSFLTSLVCVQACINKGKCALLMNAVTLWFAFSIQGFQLVLYNLFYLPLFVELARQHRSGARDLLWRFSVSALPALALSAPAVSDMVSHYLSSENTRGLGTSLVYDYFKLTPGDWGHMLFGRPINPALRHTPPGFFHEANYPLGLLGVLFFTADLPRRVKLAFGASWLLAVSFSLGIPPGSWFAQLPLFSAFRVPQRSLIFLAYIGPLIALARTSWDLSAADLVLPALTLMTWLFFPQQETVIVILGGVAILAGTFWPPMRECRTGIALVGLFCLVPMVMDRLPFWKQSYQAYRNADRLLARAQREFGKPMTGNVFHLEGGDSVHLNAVAKIRGIKTLEGYGHPPRALLEKVESLTGRPYEVGQNHLYLDPSLPGYQEALKSLGVEYVLRFKVSR